MLGWSHARYTLNSGADSVKKKPRAQTHRGLKCKSKDEGLGFGWAAGHFWLGNGWSDSRSFWFITAFLGVAVFFRLAALAIFATAGLTFFVASGLHVAAFLGVAVFFRLAALAIFTTAGLTFFIASGLHVAAFLGVAGLHFLATFAVFAATGLFCLSMSVTLFVAMTGSAATRTAVRAAASICC